VGVVVGRAGGVPGDILGKISGGVAH
jgi:hypothetical protein